MIFDRKTKLEVSERKKDLNVMEELRKIVGEGFTIKTDIDYIEIDKNLSNEEINKIKQLL